MKKLALSLTVVLSAGLLFGCGKKEPTKIDQIFTPEVLSSNLSYFESITGPAMDNFGDTRDYKVGECKLSATVQKNKVVSVELNLSPKCTFDMHKVAPSFPEGTYAHKLTFGDFDKYTQGDGRYVSGCIHLCGASYTPSVYQYWSGARPDNFIEILVGAEQTYETPAYQATEKWKEMMINKEGEDYVMNTKFNCGKYNREAHELFKKVSLNTIRVGSDIDKVLKGDFIEMYCKR